ncbi:MAG: M64 family metallo-endopeptidase [Bacteroidales bacterium]|nr:M64 family metallo-endopeptidase [Bacteroidales bacterium]
MYSQPLGLDTIFYNGHTNKLINVVIMGDGYTFNQQDKFLQDATQLINYFFNCSPWKEYKQFFNVFVIKIASADSGCSHPGTAPDCYTASPQVPITAKNTYFGCSFDRYNIHRLVTPNNYSNIFNTLAQFFPDYDQVLIIANTPYYGGSGGVVATSTMHTASSEILLHEAGHSFAYLADEYWAGAQYAAEKPNMTQQSNPQLIKWKNWLTTGTGIGIFPHTGDPSWYKPSQNCKMQALSYNFCSVCKEAIVERIHSLVNPILDFFPSDTIINFDVFASSFFINALQPSPNTLSIKWYLNSSLIVSDTNSCLINEQQLSIGWNTLSVIVFDTTQLVRVDNHSNIHFNKITWHILKSSTGFSIYPKEEKICLTLWPNPLKNKLNIKWNNNIEDTAITVNIYDLHGTVVFSKEYNISNQKHIAVDISGITSGSYIVVLQSITENIAAKLIIE